MTSSELPCRAAPIRCSAKRGMAVGEYEINSVSSIGPPEERVIWDKRFQSETFDFRGKVTFARFDRCEFVKCSLLIDEETGQLAFTQCVFKDCNIDELHSDEARGIYIEGNSFERPLEERRAAFEAELEHVLANRKEKRR